MFTLYSYVNTIYKRSVPKQVFTFNKNSPAFSVVYMNVVDISNGDLLDNKCVTIKFGDRIISRYCIQSCAINITLS